MGRGRLLVLASAGFALACSSEPGVPEQPTWADVAPVLRGECNSCHGWTAAQTGANNRFDFFDVTSAVCGDASLAMDTSVILAGSPATAMQIASDVVAQSGAGWPRMPPQPSPAVPDWQQQMLVRWAAQPVKGPPPGGNRPPTIRVSQFPSTASSQLAFTADVVDPDGDSVIGVIEVNGLAFLMNRTGSFAVNFDSSTWPAGPARVSAVLCDGWTNARYDLGPVQIQH